MFAECQTASVQLYANILSIMISNNTETGGAWETAGAETFAKGTSMLATGIVSACVSLVNVCVSFCWSIM